MNVKCYFSNTIPTLPLKIIKKTLIPSLTLSTDDASALCFTKLISMLWKRISEETFAVPNSILSINTSNHSLYLSNKEANHELSAATKTHQTVNSTLQSCRLNSGTSFLEKSNNQNRKLSATETISWKYGIRDRSIHCSKHSNSTVTHNNTKVSLDSYPVYTGKTVPPYVYQYRLSYSKYRQLLTGLVLFNLAAISSNHSEYKNYRPEPGEICKFGVRYENGKSDEMNIDCRTVTHFILTKRAINSYNDSEATKEVHSTNSVKVLSVKVDDYLNTTVDSKPKKVAATSNHNQVSSCYKPLSRPREVLRTVTSETDVINATDPIFYGRPVDVTSEMECYVIGSMNSLHVRKAVPCHVLQEYTVGSFSSTSGIIAKSLIMVAMKFLICSY